ncbi:AAWKG family protein [Streptomyces sp. NPDC014735]|uniref:AAWKG family protein n=1 Tax=unclassified Streptomyces TaxID=2593676 RepID=UPI0036F8426A
MPLQSTTWEAVIKQITGFDGGTREDVGRVGGSDEGAVGGSEWMRIRIEHVRYNHTVTEQPAGETPERVIKFYSSDSSTSNNSYYAVHLSLPWSAEKESDWSNTGVAGAYDWGYGQALSKLVTDFTTTGFTFGSRPAVDAEHSLNLKSLVTTARAFDRVQEFFSSHSPKLEEWHKGLGDENAVWKGSGADVFRSLIDGLNIGYKDFVHLLAPKTGPSPKSDAGYSPKSVVGEQLVLAENALYSAASELNTAWVTWTSKPDWLPTYHLDALLDKVAIWINANNIAKMTGSAGSWSKASDFSVTMPEYGDLTQEESWKNVSRAAYQEWLKTLVPLDTAAETQAMTLNAALAKVDASAGSYTFTPGVSSLKNAYAENEAKRQQEELKQQQEDLKNQQEEANKNLQKQQEDANKNLEKALGGNGSGTGLGTDGKGGVEQPPLGPNGLSGSGGPNGGTSLAETGLGNGNTSPTGKTDVGAPPLNPNRTSPPPGGGTLNPDGSVTRPNGDGSWTTTFPDGHKETTPPGVLPPLGPNGGGTLGPQGPGSSNAPLKTVKGPDSSTTSFNADGSRTTTHKDGTTTTVDKDGTTTTINPDGTKTVLNKDGSETVTYQDGTRSTIGPDGTTITQYPDGSSTKLAPNSTLTSTDAQGNSTVSHPEPGQTVKHPDGSTTTFGKDGSTTTQYPDGTRTTVAANGTVTTVDPDGTKTVSHLGKGTSTIEYADGSVAKVGSDGSVTTTYKDGSTTKLGPDGTYTTTDPQGHKTTEHLNTMGGGAGAETKHNADGSTTTRYPDGTTDQRFKDGGHKITYPDGRSVTTDAYGRTTSASGGAGLSSNKTSGGGWGDYDYYDYPDSTKRSSAGPLSGGYGGGPDSSGRGGTNPPLAPNPLGGQGLTPLGGSGAAGAAGGPGMERTRSLAAAESNAVRARNAQLAAEEAAMMRRPATSSSSSGMPMMPPMGGGAGGMGGATQSDERERHTWVSEDEEVWGTDEGGVAGVIGR